MVSSNVATEWPQIIFETSPEDSDPLEEALFAVGALSVQYQDLQNEPVLEPAPGEIRLWQNIRLVGLFAQGTDTDAVMASLRVACDDVVPAHRWVALADQTWERVWMDSFVPMQFGSRLWICPTHSEAPDADACNMRLDPGLAFGTGTHETTRQCLEWIDRNDLNGKKILDYGCGSGVLAIAGAMLGASHVDAVDIDRQALAATLSNAELNGVADRISVAHPDDILTQSFDVVLANILFQPLLQLAPRFADLVRSSGILVMSGVLDSQVDELCVGYNQWFKFQHIGQQGSWAILEATRN